MIEYDLYSEFDVEQHKKKFVNYLEVMIDNNGTVHYAVPSHQENAICVCMKKMGVSRKGLCDLCPPEYYGDFLNWLCLTGNLVAVWNDFCVAPAINRKQRAALIKLKMSGLYKGAIPFIMKKEGGNEYSEQLR